MSKTVDNTLINRRSIRRYERQSISADDMQFIYDAIRNTPTSYNGQQYSVIDITDQSLKEQIYGITGEKQIKTCNHFLVFCADYNKITIIAQSKGIDSLPFTHTTDGYTVGVIDASLAMMSALIAAESRGLGTCCVGYMRTADPDRLSRLLQLPNGVSIICGLTIGIPRELPDLKPKQPQSLLI
ncbi:MAG: nitroreductase family protein, partial [Muribaculaceae bacterium]|nr:nitroreductase family protein [Muribaculaceae bacterium]